jgi:hypothetical protein
MTDPNVSVLGPEPMIDAKQAAVALRLPYYWFSDPAMRVRYRIPHYLIGAVVRYRASELAAWAARSAAVQTRGPGDAQGSAEAQGGHHD